MKSEKLTLLVPLQEAQLDAPRRDELRPRLAARDIETGLHYPVPLHEQEALRGRARCSGPLSVAEHAAAHTLSLPVFPGLTRAQVRVVAAAVKASVAPCDAVGSSR